jgi:RNA polymerase sigma factor (sigma-70 family)
MGRVTNRQIVEELRNGDRKGAGHLVDTYQDRLISEAVSIFHIDSLDAEELVSDVLLSVIQKIDSFEFEKSDGDFHFWVMTIFRNRVRDHVRHETLKGGLMERFEESALENDQEYSQTELDVVRAVVRQYESSLQSHEGSNDDPRTVPGKLHVIAATLDAMETWERVLLRCRALDVPYEDISHYTGKPVSQLKVYHQRVRKKFVKLLSEHYPELAIS